MKINENTELTYRVIDENNTVLGTFDTRNEANIFIYKSDLTGESTLLWSVIPHKIQKSYILTNNNYGDDDFTLEIKTLEDLIEGLKQAKALGESHIHLEVIGRSDSSSYNIYFTEVVIPLKNDYKNNFYVRGI